MDSAIARDARQLGAILRRARRQRKLTQAQLGGRMNVRQATVSTLEEGSAGSSLKTLLDALSALDLELVIRPRTKGGVEVFEDMF
ncbi:MAG: helix-turn-helix domain-containing protein [Reyranellales bacterium]|jgi:HTH-type transcriptional regulator / antitoxin HipB